MGGKVCRQASEQIERAFVGERRDGVIHDVARLDCVGAQTCVCELVSQVSGRERDVCSNHGEMDGDQRRFMETRVGGEGST